MSGINLRVFGGVKPKIDPYLLPENMAQVASNCRLTSGTIDPWRKPLVINTPTKAGTKISMYRVPYGGVDYWWSWTTDVNVVKSQIGSDAYNRYYFTGDGVPKVTTDLLAITGGGTDYPITSYTLGLPVPTTPTISGIVGGAAANQTRAYYYTLVSAWGEEGPPSLPVTNTGKADAVWTVQLPQIAQPGGGTYQVATKNVYRTVTAADGTVLYLLVASGIALATASYADGALDAALIGGTVLPSTTWIAPPTGLSGLVALPSGSMVGFTGNQLCISEPYQPHAWPTAYRYSVDFNIVGIAVNGNSIVVGTTGNSYVFTGSTPDGMTPTKGESIEPCLSKRSMVDVGWGVLYSSPNGLVNGLITSGASTVVTTDSILSADWRASYHPSTMVGALYEGLYHGYYTTGTGVGAGLIVNKTSDFGFKEITDYITGAWTDPTTALLYVIIGGNIVQWDADTANNMTFDWESRVIGEVKPTNYGVIQVEADFEALIGGGGTSSADILFNTAMLLAGTDGGELGRFALGEIPLGGSLLHGGAAERFVQIQLYAGGVLKYTKSFTDRKVAKLPSGFKHDHFEVRVSGNVSVKSIKIAENAKALARL